jgi:putative NADH-flavin reductase
MQIEIEHEGSCLGATGGTGRLIVRDALAKGHSVVVLIRSKARAMDLPGRSIAVPPGISDSTLPVSLKGAS